MKTTLAIVIMFGLMMLTGCSAVGGAADVEPRPEIPVDPRIVGANTGFGLRLMQAIVQSTAEENIFISPASISMALAMTSNGAARETLTAMADTLGIGGVERSELNRAYADVRTLLDIPGPGIRLTVANSLWARQGIDFLPDFLQRTADHYGAEPTTLDFDSPAAVNRINSWVSDNTGGLIEEIVDHIDPDSIMFLINAIHFKGAWSIQFDPARTLERSFYRLDGTEISHPLMSRRGSLEVRTEDAFTAVRLPYGGGQMSMYVFLPAEDSTVTEFCLGLDEDGWDRMFSGFSQIESEIIFPRFSIDSDVNLGSILRTLGMDIAFDRDRADFSDLCPIPPNVYIGGVRHRAFVEVNEEGTEAAAATSVEMKVVSMPQVHTIICDRPFLFAVRDDDTGMLLFTGILFDPGI